MKATAIFLGLMVSALSATAQQQEDLTRIVSYEELAAAGFEIPFSFTDKIPLTYGLLKQAKAEIAAQRRINELLEGVSDRASADAAAAEIATQRAVFSVGEQADILAVFILECYPDAVKLVYAYEDLKLKLKKERYHGSDALRALLR